VAQARQAYEVGHGKLLALLREIGGEAEVNPAKVREAREILARIEESSRREPISQQPPVRAPSLEANPLGPSAVLASGPIGSVPAALKEVAARLSGL
jgi:hypothetical protein